MEGRASCHVRGCPTRRTWRGAPMTLAGVLAMSENWLLGLHWGIKKSFLDYVARMPDGRGIFRDGATLADGSIAVFEPDVEAEHPEAADADLFLAFHGDVHFSGHFGMLNVRS